jgi:hypothetical protein
MSARRQREVRTKSIQQPHSSRARLCRHQLGHLASRCCNSCCRKDLSSGGWVHRPQVLQRRSENTCSTSEHHKARRSKTASGRLGPARQTVRCNSRRPRYCYPERRETNGCIVLVLHSRSCGAKQTCHLYMEAPSLLDSGLKGQSIFLRRLEEELCPIQLLL